VKLEGATVWHVSGNSVLAFSELGGKGDMIEMPNQVELKLILQREKWGLFEYAARDGGTGKGWIFMKSVNSSR